MLPCNCKIKKNYSHPIFPNERCHHNFTDVRNDYLPEESKSDTISEYSESDTNSGIFQFFPEPKFGLCQNVYYANPPKSLNPVTSKWPSSETDDQYCKLGSFKLDHQTEVKPFTAKYSKPKDKDADIRISVSRLPVTHKTEHVLHDKHCKCKDFFENQQDVKSKFISLVESKSISLDVSSSENTTLPSLDEDVENIYENGDHFHEHKEQDQISVKQESKLSISNIKLLTTCPNNKMKNKKRLGYPCSIKAGRLFPSKSRFYHRHSKQQCNRSDFNSKYNSNKIRIKRNKRSEQTLSSSQSSKAGTVIEESQDSTKNSKNIKHNSNVDSETHNSSQASLKLDKTEAKFDKNIRDGSPRKKNLKHFPGYNDFKEDCVSNVDKSETDFSSIERSSKSNNSADIKKIGGDSLVEGFSKLKIQDQNNKNYYDLDPIFNNLQLENKYGKHRFIAFKKTTALSTINNSVLKQNYLEKVKKFKAEYVKKEPNTFYQNVVKMYKDALNPDSDLSRKLKI